MAAKNKLISEKYHKICQFIEKLKSKQDAMKEKSQQQVSMFARFYMSAGELHSDMNIKLISPQLFI